MEKNASGEPVKRSNYSIFQLIKQRINWPGSHRVIPYVGYANNQYTFITGEVTESLSIAKPKEGQSKWKNFKSMVKRYLGNDIEGAKVRIHYRGQTKEEVTDEYGIFKTVFEHKEVGVSGSSGKEKKGVGSHMEVKMADENNSLKEKPSSEKPTVWGDAKIELIHPPGQENIKHEAIAEIMHVGATPDFGIISDIDDTILVSYATQKLTKFRLMMVNNAFTRLPFEGVSEFYTALQQGVTGNSYNPIFYVSNSEWNLYDLIYEFIKFNRIPKGPLFLREFSIGFFQSSELRQIRKTHKSTIISRLFAAYPDMKFILIGDSGQHDPEIYYETVKKYPGRVLCIYIRDIGIPKNSAQVKTISNNLYDAHKVEMVLVKDTISAVKHASGKYIRPLK